MKLNAEVEKIYSLIFGIFNLPRRCIVPKEASADVFPLFHRRKKKPSTSASSATVPTRLASP